MVELPRRRPQLVTVEEPRSRISERDVEAPFAGLARALGDVGAAAEQVAEPLAEKAGIKSVSTGDDGLPVINRGALPIVGRAGEIFRRTSLLTYQANVEPKAENELLKMRLENPHDPDAYQKAASAYIDQLSSNAEKVGGPALGQSVRHFAEQHAAQNYRTSLTQTDALSVQNALVGYKTRIGNLDNQMAAMARDSGADTDEFKRLQSETLGIYKQLAADKRFKYPQDRIDTELSQMADRHGAQVIIGELRPILNKKTPNAKEEARQYLQDKFWDPRVLPNLSPADRQGFIGQGMAWIEAKTTENKALKDAHTKLVNETLKGLETGAPYDQRLVNDLKQRAVDANDPESYYKLFSYEALKGPRDALFKQPISKQIEVLRALQTGPTSFEASLVARESGGRLGIVNDLGYAGKYQFGAPRLAALGVYTPGTAEDLQKWSASPKDAAGKWSGTFNVPGMPQIKTLQDFLGSDDAQRVAFATHKTKMDAEITGNGLERFEGKVVGGVQITREGLYGMLHLGGLGSTKAALESDGKINPTDANKTSVLDYARLGRPAITASTTTGEMWGEAARADIVNNLRTHYAAEAEKLTSTAEAALGQGRRLNDQEVHNLAEVITATGRTDLAQRLSNAVGGFDAATKLTGLPVALRNSWRAAMQVRAADAPDPLERKVIDFAEQVVKNVQAGMAVTPYTTGAARGLHVEPFALNPADPAAFAAAVKQRAGFDRIHQIHDGQGPKSVFEPGEAEAFRGALVNAKPEQIGQLFQGLQQLDDAQLVATLGDAKVKDGVRNAMRMTVPAKFSVIMSSLDAIYARAPSDFQEIMGEPALHALKDWQAVLRYADPKTQLEERNRIALAITQTGVRKEETDHAETIAKKYSAHDIEAGIDTIWNRAVWPEKSAPVIDEDTRRQMMSDYRTIFVRRYIATQDQTKAHDQTIEMMRPKWQRSALNDDRMMLNAPESVYDQIGRSHAWMKNQVEADLTKLRGPRYKQLYGTAAGIVTTRSMPLWDYSLVPDRQTDAEVRARDPEKPPSYRVVVRNNLTDKLEPQYDARGVPMRYHWEIGPDRSAYRKDFAADRQHVFNPSLGWLGAP